MVYADVYSARYNAASAVMISPDSLNNRINASESQNNFVLIYGQYAAFNPQSITNGWLNYSRGKLTATGNGNPFELQQVWAAYPTKSYYSNDVSFTYNTSFYFNNTGVTINNLFVNFGGGYTAVAANGTVSHTYNDSSGLKVIKIKAILSNGQQLETQMVVYVSVTSAIMASRYTAANLNAPDFVVPPQAGVHAGCKVYLRRSIATPNNKILKPFIIVEGLDINSALPTIVDNYNINKYILELNATLFNTGQNLSDQLDNIAHYDLIFVDWGNGVGDIPGNAVALEAVIDWVNQQKLNSSSSEQNVIMGISMGGLVARYSLADMVKRSPRKATGTRLLLTMDSPHQGAYVPISFQHLIMALPDVTGPLGIRLGSILNNTLDKVKNNLLLSPGAQQQLNLLVTDANGTVVPNVFLQNAYRNKITFSNGITPEYDFKAISNGSQCGIPVLTPGDNLISGYASANLTGAVITLQVLLNFPNISLPWITKLKYKTELVANALNGNNNHEILYYKLMREEKLFFIINNNKTFVEIHRNEPTFNTIPWESISGGTQSLGNRLGLNGNSNQTIQSSWSFISPWFLGYNVNVSLAPQWGFLPVTSALDIINPTSQNSQYIFPVQGTNGSTSSKYIAQEYNASQGGYNINHTNFTARNSQWIFREMENINQTYDCTYECPLNFTTTITGPNNLCSTATYNTNNLNNLEIAGINVTPIGLATFTLNSNNTITVNAQYNSSGFITISIPLRIPGCNASAPIVKQVYVGKPKSVVGLNALDIINNCSFIDIRLTPIGGEGATNFNWFTDYQSNPGYQLRFSRRTGGAQALTSNYACVEIGMMKVEAVNACGVNIGTSYTQQIGGECYPYDIPNCQQKGIIANVDSLTLNVAPNPVKNILSAQLNYTQDYKQKNKEIHSQKITKILIVNSSGNIVLQAKVNNSLKQFININKLTPGNYTISAFIGNRWVNTHFIKE